MTNTTTRITFAVLLFSIALFGYVAVREYGVRKIKQTDEITENTLWRDNVSQYEILNRMATGHTLLIGDSMAYRYQVEEFFPRMNVLNRGNVWDDSRTLLQRLDRTVLNANPSLVIILIGTNDILHRVPVEETLANVGLMIERIRTHQSSVAVISILPVWMENRRKNSEIALLNHSLKELCVARQVEFIDVYKRFLSSEGELRRDLSSDGVHLNGDGYAILTSALLGFLPNNTGNIH